MFTFSFGSAMATTYTLDDYATALTAEKTAQLGYINSVKTQYVNSLNYDKDGFATINGVKYMKAAIEVAADEVISDADKAMKAAIDNKLNNFEDTTTAPDKSVVADVAAGYNTVAVFGPLVESKATTLNKAQAPLTKKFVQDKLAVDLSKYNSTDKTETFGGQKLTRAQYVQALIDDANKKIATADKESTDVAKMSGYWTAYDEFKSAFDAVKTLDDEKYEEEIGAGTVEAAVEAYDAYHAFTKMAGADVQGITSSVTLLQQKYDKVNELVAEEIDAKAKAINKKLDDLTGSDADIAAKVALKAEAEAILAEAKALTDEIEAVNEDHDKFLKDVTMNEVEKLDEVDFSLAVATDASRKLTKAGKEGATFEEMKEALDAYNALTDKQKYQLDAKALPLIKVLEQKLGMTVKSLKITAKSTAKKGFITVKWTVKGDASAADGYQVWKSTKQSKGYKKAITTTKKSYKNTKGLKKGTRYYYKVRAYKVVDGKNVYSDWSNKAYRVAK